MAGVTPFMNMFHFDKKKRKELKKKTLKTQFNPLTALSQINYVTYIIIMKSFNFLNL